MHLEKILSVLKGILVDIKDVNLLLLLACALGAVGSAPLIDNHSVQTITTPAQNDIPIPLIDKLYVQKGEPHAQVISSMRMVDILRLILKVYYLF